MEDRPAVESLSSNINLPKLIAGVILVIISVMLVFWNEGVGLRGARSVKIGGFDVIVIPNAPVDIANNNKVIYTHGIPASNATMQDPLFGFSEKAISLKRKVEMYQWQQTLESKKAKLDDGTDKETVVYTYKPVWSDQLIDSNGFKDSVGHQNPVNMPVAPVRGMSQDVRIGDFRLAPEFVAGMDMETPVDLSNADLTALQQHFKVPAQHDGQYVYIGVNTKSPAIGDLRISLYKVEPQEISIIAVQRDAVLAPLVLSDNKPQLLIMKGQLSPAQMLIQGKSSNAYLPWAIRMGTLILSMISMILILQGSGSAIANWPLLPKMGVVTSGVASGYGVWSLATIISWFIIRPLFAVILLAITLIIFFILFKRYQSDQ